MKAPLGKRLQHAYRVAHSVVRETLKDSNRSPMWPSVRNAYLRDHPLCQACGSHKRLQVHHKKPFHLFPELELLASNFIVLCMDEAECHLHLGHAGSFSCWNPDVESDVAEVREYPDLRSTIESRARLARKR